MATIDYTGYRFSGPDHICSPCAKDMHRAAGTEWPADIYERAIYGWCAACGESEQLLPAHRFGVAAPSKAAHRFAAAVADARWGQGRGEHMKGLSHIRARCESGYYWVQFETPGTIHVHTEATRNQAEAVARFMRAVG